MADGQEGVGRGRVEKVGGKEERRGNLQKENFYFYFWGIKGLKSTCALDQKGKKGQSKN
jgi:hypothetical protein